MRIVSAILAALVLASCSSESGLNPAVSAIYGQLKPGDEQAATAKGSSGGGRKLTREMIDKSGLALIRARLGEETSPIRLAAVTKNGANVTYLSRSGQHIALNGTAITATRGMGHDLLSAQSSRGDPLIVPTIPARWPEKLTRSYRFYGDGPNGRVETFACRLEPSGKGNITIVEITYPTVRFIETCSNGATSFENTYFADARTGFVWRSRQWISPRLPQMDFDVLEPLTD